MNKMVSMREEKFKTREEIAKELNISYKTLYRILKNSDLCIPKNKLISPKNCRRIYELINSM